MPKRKNKKKALSIAGGDTAGFDISFDVSHDHVPFVGKSVHIVSKAQSHGSTLHQCSQVTFSDKDSYLTHDPEGNFLHSTPGDVIAYASLLRNSLVRWATNLDGIKRQANSVVRFAPNAKKFVSQTNQEVRLMTPGTFKFVVLIRSIYDGICIGSANGRNVPLRVLSLCEGPHSVFKTAMQMYYPLIVFNSVGEDTEFEDVCSWVENNEVDSDIVLFDPAGSEHESDYLSDQDNIGQSVTDYAYECIGKVCSGSFQFLILKIRLCMSVATWQLILNTLIEERLSIKLVYSNPLSRKGEFFFICERGDPYRNLGKICTHFSQMFWNTKQALVTLKSMEELLESIGCTYSYKAAQDGCSKCGYLHVLSVSDEIRKRIVRNVLGRQALDLDVSDDA